VAAAYFALHLPLLAPSLEDIDSINFALGLREFDIVRHQPHPPGYPVYIVLGRLSRLALGLVPSLDPGRADALALAWWSALGGMLAIVGASRLFAAVDRQFANRHSDSQWPAVLLAVAPLFWMSGLRPMSDMPGLAAVLWSQALLVEGARSTRMAIAGAGLAGAAAGIRIQTLALTLPVIAVMLAATPRGARFQRALVAAGAFGFAGLLWAVPLLAQSGGLTGYLEAISAQAGEDFAFVDMLWADPTPRHLARALRDTFVAPWAVAALAAVVGLSAGLGLVVSIVRVPKATTVILAAFVPYVAYHLLLQETMTVRYALPVMPLVAWLAAQGAAALPRGGALAGLVAATAFVASARGALAYGGEAHPAYRALDEARARGEVRRPGGVFAHVELRRALQHGGGRLPFVEPSPRYEWMGPFDYWRRGGSEPVWFFADPRRTDLDLIDPESRRDVRSYSWTLATRPELGGSRPLGVDWYRLSTPRWFVGTGWSLTPEAGGVTRVTRNGPDHRPIEAWIRRSPEPGTLMVGGLRLGGSGDARITVTLDGTPLETWEVDGASGPFLRFIPLPADLDTDSAYATLRLESRGVDGGRGPEVAIRQFGLQRTGGVVYGFGEGWHEAEYNPASGARWRWTSGRSLLEVRGTAQPLVLVLRGESSRPYYDTPPRVRVTADGRLLHDFTPTEDFTERIAIPVGVWRGGRATVVIESDRVYLPGAVEGTGDPRRLGLRLWDVQIDTVLP
jgi:hypothetical protein